MAGYATNLRNAQLDAITTFAGNSALLRAYDGTQPATGGAVTTKLVEWTLGTPFAPASAAGVLSPTLPVDTTGLVSGQCTWLRIVKSDGVTFVMDIPVSQITLNTSNVVLGDPAKVLGFTIAAGNT
jgi:hypothetical protein